MSDLLSGIGGAASASPMGPRPLPAAQGESGGSFRGTLERALGQAQGLQDRAGDTVGAFLRGEPVEIHEVMAAVEESGIALELLIEVRNRLTEAYRTVVNMQS